MKRLGFIVAGLVLAVAAVVYARELRPPVSSTFAAADATCSRGQPAAGDLCLITDCNSATNCTAGGGANSVLMIYSGAAWVHHDNLSGAGGTSSLTGTTSETWTIDSDGNVNTIDANTDGTFLLNRDEAGAVTVSCSDDDATAECIYDSGGASRLTVGSADVTSVRLLADNDANIENGATGAVSLAFRDYADTVDDDQDHVILTTNCTDAGSGTEDCDLTVGITEAGAAPETRLNFDADGGITLGSANTDTITVSSADDALTFGTNGDSINNAADATFDLTRNDAGAVTLTASDDDATAALTVAPGGASSLTLGSASATDVTVTADNDVQIHNGATGDVTLDFRDYADTTDDDQAHALLTTNCTDTGSGTEDCDFTVGIVEGGAAPETRLNFDGDGGITLGSANTDTLTFTSADDAITYGTNADSINNAADATFDFTRNDAGTVTLTASDDDATAALTVAPGGAEKLTIGSASATDVTLEADNDVQVVNGATGAVTLDFRDYADTTDDDQAHALLTTNCTDTGSGTEDCDFTIGIVESGAAPETRLNFDGDGGITLGSANTDTITIQSADAALTYATNSDSINNAADATFDFTRNDAGAVTITASDDDATADLTVTPGGAGGLVLGSATTTAVGALTTDQFTITNNTGTEDVVVAFRDYADTTDDDQNHGEVAVNCTDTGSGTEDCDLTLNIVEGGAAPEARLTFDADSGVDIGSANTDDFTVTTDGTGESEVQLPADSIDATELSDDACTSVISVTYNPTEAGATDDYVSLNAVDLATGDASFSATEGNEDQFLAPAVSTIANNLQVAVDVAPGVGNDDWTITLREAGGSTALTCTIAETATGCSDTSNNETIALGTQLNFLVTSESGGADPTAAAEMNISFCMTAD